MLDVHPPHAAVHGWRDFAVHLLTITAGLLIALGLEAAVEAAHHHELAARARENIEQEITRNVVRARDNIASVQMAIADTDGNLAAARLHLSTKDPAGHVHVHASWMTFDEAAWLTARESGALAHMPLEEVQRYAGVYSRQQALEHEADSVMHAALLAMSPLEIQGGVAMATDDDWRAMMQRSADAKQQLLVLSALVQGLNADYANAQGTSAPEAASEAASAVPASGASAASSASRAH